jgi:hypothetical protein
MDQNARLKDLVIFPFPVVILDNRRKILPEVPWAQVREPIFHRFIRVKKS